MGWLRHLGGPHLPAVGFAAGIESLALLIETPQLDMPDVIVVSAEPDADHRLFSACRKAAFSRHCD